MAFLEAILPLILTFSNLTAAAQPTSSATQQSILNAVDTLVSSGYTAMSLTLHVIAPTLPVPSSTRTALTIFCPPDSSFSASGQPSLAHLLLHLSPLWLSPSSLLSLPLSSPIPSLLPDKHLFITSNGVKQISVSNVRISDSPIYDDGYVIAYAIDDFFDLNFSLGSTNRTKVKPKSDFQCSKLETTSRFEEASGVLKARGYSIFGSFLDLQMSGFLQPGPGYSEDAQNKWTLFAPPDEELVQFSGDFLQYSSLFMRHLVPCKHEWADLEETANGTVISNNVKGFSLEITRDEHDQMLMVNGVNIMSPDMFDNDWLVIHGMGGMIPLPDSMEEEMKPEVSS